MSLRKILYSVIMIGIWCLFHPYYLVAQDSNRNDSLKNRIQNENPNTKKVDLLLALAEEYKTQIPDTAIAFSLQAKYLSDSLSYIDGQYLSRRILAEAFSGISNFRQALIFANEAEGYIKIKNNPKEEVRILRIFGLIFTELGEFEKGANYYFASLKICEDQQDQTCLSTSYNSIGRLFFNQGDFKKALKYYSKSLKIARELNDQIGIARGLNNQAIIYSENKNYKIVKELLREAISINQKSGMRLWEGINYLNLGTLYRDQSVYDSSIVYYHKASEVFHELHHYRLIVNNDIGISRYYEEVNNLDESIIIAKEAFEIAKDHDLIIVEAQAAQRLYELYTEIGNKEEAFHHGLIYFQLKDSLEIEKSATKLAQLELLYEFDKKNHFQQIEEQRKETHYIIALVSLFFIGVLIVIVLLARQKLKAKSSLMAKKQLEVEIELKDKELTLNVMSLLKKNEVLANIVDKLMGVHDNAIKDETKSSILQIAKDIQKTSEDEIWEEFEVRFKQAHGDYYDRLTQKYPTLSPNEMKLCAFLKLNMSTKDISELTGQSVGALEIARTRLRKKLGITNTKINLIGFISQI